MSLTGELKGCCSRRWTCKRKVVRSMVTYSDLIQFTIMVFAIVAVVISLVRKK